MKGNMTNGLLKSDELIGSFVNILLKAKMVDPQTGLEVNFGKTGFFRGCDGLFVYYCMSEDPKCEISGFVLASDVLDVVRVDHMEMFAPDDEDENE